MPDLIYFVSFFLIEKGTVDFFYNSYIVEIFGGLILSIMTLLLIWFLRPRVIISPKIAAKKTQDDTTEYHIKIINKSYIFQLLDIRFEFTMLKPLSSPKGMNVGIREIPLVSNHVWFLSRRKGYLNKLFGKDTYATYAIIVKISPDFNLSEEWKKNSDNGTYFDLKVIAKNNFSGITSIIHEKFSHPSCIKSGEYCHGNTVDIEQHND